MSNDYKLDQLVQVNIQGQALIGKITSLSKNFVTVHLPVDAERSDWWYMDLNMPVEMIEALNYTIYK